MHYSIKDLAKILGCTTSAIHYFEKEKLITVAKEKNGHRYYNVVDVFRLLSYNKYRSMGMPMKTIVNQFSGQENNRKLIEARELQYKEEALQKAQAYLALADAIESHLVSIRRIDDLLNQYELAQSPEMILMCDEECGWLSKDRNAQQVVNIWVEAMPEVQLGVFHESLQMSHFGYIVDPKRQSALQLPTTLKTKYLPAMSCLHTIVTAEEDFTVNPQGVFRKAMDYIASKGLEPAGAAWGKILLVEVEAGAKLHPYVELWLSIKI